MRVEAENIRSGEMTAHLHRLPHDGRDRRRGPAHRRFRRSRRRRPTRSAARVRRSCAATTAWHERRADARPGRAATRCPSRFGSWRHSVNLPLLDRVAHLHAPVAAAARARVRLKVASTCAPSPSSAISSAWQGSARVEDARRRGVRSRNGRPWSMSAPGAKKDAAWPKSWRSSGDQPVRGSRARRRSAADPALTWATRNRSRPARSAPERALRGRPGARPQAYARPGDSRERSRA